MSERLVNTFIELVKIESPSGKEQKVAEWIVKYFKGLGVTSITDSSGNIIAKIEGVKGPYFILNAHIDTVTPCTNIIPCIKDGIISSNGDTILGADDKAGVAAILELVAYIKENQIKHNSIEIIFTVQEEVGIMGVQKLNFPLIDGKTGVTIDGDKINSVIVGAPYIAYVDIEISGKGAHSGVEPEKGISAIKISGNAIARLKFGRIDKETTANIGKIKGGELRNSIPEKVEITAEVRSHNLIKLNKNIEKIKKVFEQEAKKLKGEINFKSEIVCKGYKISKTSPIIKKIGKAYKNIKLKPDFKLSGGGSDANVFHAHNIKVVNIGTGAKNVHTTSEQIAIEDLNRIFEVTLDLVKI